MRFFSIASGSSGNCVYVGSKEANLLVDAGVSGKRIEEALSTSGIIPEKLDGLFITHEHSDHIQGVGILARRYQIPIYATEGTIDNLLRCSIIGKIPREQINFVEPNKSIRIKDIIIEPFSISHDASNPVSYTFLSGGHKLGMATDLGMYDDYIISKLEGSDCLYLEANHDVNMLMVGHYPYSLKRRIAGERGHLSNETSAELICRLQSERLKYIVLAHLSKENNYAELAYETVHAEIIQHWEQVTQPVISVANRDIPSGMIDF